MSSTTRRLLVTLPFAWFLGFLLTVLAHWRGGIQTRVRPELLSLTGWELFFAEGTHWFSVTAYRDPVLAFCIALLVSSLWGLLLAHQLGD